MSRADIQERARLLDQIDRLEVLFGSRFHLDTQCGSCNGPLECDRDAICHRCTDAIEIKRLQAIVDRLPKTADGEPIAPGDEVFVLGAGHARRVRAVHRDSVAVTVGCIAATLVNIHPHQCYSTREAAEQARAT